MYEAITHAHNRVLYGKPVTDFPHVRREFVDAYARLIAMKLFTDRAVDYFRSAHAEDRRYLLFNPITKMKVTTEGERVIDLLCGRRRGQGLREGHILRRGQLDIDGLPKLEGTVARQPRADPEVHAGNYLLMAQEYPEVPTRTDAADDEFLFQQGPARGLGKVRFHDWRAAYARAADVPNVARFTEQAEALVAAADDRPAAGRQIADMDFLIALGELFTLVVYGQLVLEQAEIDRPRPRTSLDQIFEILVRDFSVARIELHGTGRRDRGTAGLGGRRDPQTGGGSVAVRPGRGIRWSRCRDATR